MNESLCIRLHVCVFVCLSVCMYMHACMQGCGMCTPRTDQSEQAFLLSLFSSQVVESSLHEISTAHDVSSAHEISTAHEISSLQHASTHSPSMSTSLPSQTPRRSPSLTSPSRSATHSTSPQSLSTMTTPSVAANSSTPQSVSASRASPSYTTPRTVTEASRMESAGSPRSQRASEKAAADQHTSLDASVMSPSVSGSSSLLLKMQRLKARNSQRCELFLPSQSPLLFCCNL